MYVFLSIQASACTLQDFDELDSSWGVSGQSGQTGAASSTGESGAPSAAGSSSTGGASSTLDIDPPPEGNLMPDPSFELGHAGWSPFGMSTILDVSMGAHSGKKCILSSGRSDNWMGPSYPAATLLTRGASYTMAAWLRMVKAPDSVQLTLKSDCNASQTFTAISAIPVGTDWTKIEGVLHVPDCDYTDLTPYFEGPVANADFWIDDVTITPL
jgi:hypothetical protein